MYVPINAYAHARNAFDDRAVAHINALLDALLRRERCIVEDHQGRPRLI